MIVDLDIAALIGSDAGLVETEIFVFGRRPDRDHNLCSKSVRNPSRGLNLGAARRNCTHHAHHVRSDLGKPFFLAFCHAIKIVREVHVLEKAPKPETQGL
jgi:hypothetical protein